MVVGCGMCEGESKINDGGGGDVRCVRGESRIRDSGGERIQLSVCALTVVGLSKTISNILEKFWPR